MNSPVKHGFQIERNTFFEVKEATGTFYLAVNESSRRSSDDGLIWPLKF
jgi:hypothetical protein